MEPVHYLRVLKRRWRLIAGITVLGLVAGLLSWYLTADTEDGDEVYAATHTLIAQDAQATRQGSGGGGGGGNSATRTGINYEQICYLARTGEVPSRVAEEVGGEAAALTNRVACTPNPNLSTVEITASGMASAATEELADIYAQTLLSYLAERGQAERDSQIADAQARVDQLQASYDELTAELDAGGDTALLVPQRDQIANQIATQQSALEDLLAQPPAEVPLTTLESATAVRLTRAEFAARLRELATADEEEGGGSDTPTARDAQVQASRARPADEGPGPIMRAGLGGGLGFLLAVVLVLLLDRLDPRVRSKDDVEEAYDLPVLAEVPTMTRSQQRAQGIVSWELPRSRIAESYRSLRSALLFASADLPRPDGPPANGAANGSHGPQEPGVDLGTAGLEDPVPESGGSGPAEQRRRGTVLLISSPGPSEGKTTVTSNLAAVFAETGSSVLVVNCDYRRPRLHTHFQVEFEPRQVLATQIPQVRIVADVVDDAEHANPADVIAAQRHVIETARDMVDVVLLDTAPLLTTNDASELLDLADMVLMVAQAGRTTHEAAFRAGELLTRRNVKAVGAVLLRAEAGPASRYYYYYRGRYYNDADAQRSGGAAPPTSPDTPATVAAGEGGSDT